MLGFLFILVSILLSPTHLKAGGAAAAYVMEDKRAQTQARFVKFFGSTWPILLDNIESNDTEAFTNTLIEFVQKTPINILFADDDSRHRESFLATLKPRAVTFLDDDAICAYPETTEENNFHVYVTSGHRAAIKKIFDISPIINLVITDRNMGGDFSTSALEKPTLTDAEKDSGMAIAAGDILTFFFKEKFPDAFIVSYSGDDATRMPTAAQRDYYAPKVAKVAGNFTHTLSELIRTVAVPCGLIHTAFKFPSGREIRTRQGSISCSPVASPIKSAVASSGATASGTNIFALTAPSVPASELSALAYPSQVDTETNTARIAPITRHKELRSEAGAALPMHPADRVEEESPLAASAGAMPRAAEMGRNVTKQNPYLPTPPLTRTGAAHSLAENPVAVGDDSPPTTVAAFMTQGATVAPAPAPAEPIRAGWWRRSLDCIRHLFNRHNRVHPA